MLVLLHTVATAVLEAVVLLEFLVVVHLAVAADARDVVEELENLVLFQLHLLDKTDNRVGNKLYYYHSR